MGVREQALSHLTGLWADGGAAVLHSAGMRGGWESVIGPLPDELLQVGGPPEVAAETLLGRLRDLYHKAGRHREALAFARAAHERISRRLGDEHPMTLLAGSRLGAQLDTLGRHDEATPYLQAAWRGLYRAFGTDPRAATAAQLLARNLRSRGDLAAAYARIEDALALRQVLSPSKLGLLLAQRAELRMEIDGDETAAPMLQDAWEVLVRERGEHDRVTLDRARILGPMWVRLEDPHRAARVLESLWKWVEPNGSPAEKARVSFDLGKSLDAIGQEERGLRLIEEGLRRTRELTEPDGTPHPDLPNRLATWARVQEQRGRRQQAEGFLLEAVEAERQIHGPTSGSVGLRQASVGDLCYRMGRLDEAIGWFEAGLGLVRADYGDESDVSQLVAERLVDLLLEKADQCFDELRDPELGWEYIYRGRGITLDVLGPDHPAHKTLKYYRKGGG